MYNKIIHKNDIPSIKKTHLDFKEIKEQILNKYILIK